MKKRMSIVAIISALIAAMTAHAQSSGGSRIVLIRLTSAECRRVPNVISVVLNGRDGENAFPAYHETGTDQWVGRSEEDFDASSSYASLRLGGARTDCAPTIPMNDQARLSFVCSFQSTRNVTVTPDPAMFPVRYVREVPRNPDNRRSIPCNEHALLQPAKRVVELVQFPSERLRLQLAWSAPNPASVSDEPPGLLVNHPSVIGKAERGGTKILGAAVVLEALREQRAEGLLGAPPSLSPNAYENDRLRLTAAGLKSLALTVQ